MSLSGARAASRVVNKDGDGELRAKMHDLSFPPDRQCISGTGVDVNSKGGRTMSREMENIGRSAEDLCERSFDGREKQQPITRSIQRKRLGSATTKRAKEDFWLR